MEFIMKKFLKRLFRIFLYIISSIIILIFLFLLIINNKKFINYDWKNYNDNTIITINDKREIYPEFKKFSREKMPEWYEYNWYYMFKFGELWIEHSYIWEEIRDQVYNNESWETENYIIKELYKFNKNWQNGSIFWEDISFDMVDRTAYYQNWQIWYEISYNKNWKLMRYYQDGSLWMKWNDDEWKLDWEWFTYYPDWKIFEYWKFEKWNWIITYYKNDWDIIWTWNYVDWKIDSWLLIYPARDVVLWWWEQWSPRKYLNLQDVYEVTLYRTYEIWKPNWPFNEYYSCGDKRWYTWTKRWYLWECKDVWPILASWYYINWFPEWEYTYYYKNWALLEKCIFEDKIWECTSYYPNGEILRDWQKEAKILFEDTPYVVYYNEEFWDRNYYDENWELVEIFEHKSSDTGNSKYRVY